MMAVVDGIKKEGEIKVTDYEFEMKITKKPQTFMEKEWGLWNNPFHWAYDITKSSPEERLNHVLSLLRNGYPKTTIEQMLKSVDVSSELINILLRQKIGRYKVKTSDGMVTIQKICWNCGIPK